ncbi:tyrosine-type recombinase/integrase [Plantactinospora sp. WMMB782]|uniref:tyrosine-type recombinase/integrase n=1 Tax=Plantactinospora sp. WMMB782 TaxID=3404121 RepID=UPI003B92BDDC
MRRGASQPDGVRRSQVGGQQPDCHAPVGSPRRTRRASNRLRGKGLDAIVFTGEKGAVLRTGNFRRAVDWSAALRAAGMPAGFHFHDLRHTGNNRAAATGASTRDLMHRMGHASMRAALIYQHANSERDREIAAGMDRRIAKAQPKPKKATRRRRNGTDPDDGPAAVPARAG